MLLITDILKKNKKLYGKDIALIEHDPKKKVRKEISWDEFDNLSNNIASFLKEQGLKKNDKVSLLMTNCIEWLPIYFGILKAGCVVSPLNFRFDVEELSYCIDLVEAKAIFFGEEFIERIDEVRKKIDFKFSVFVGEKNNKPSYSYLYNDIIKVKAKNKNFPKLKEDDDAALYFTSGTTGKPKAVLLTNKNLSFSCIVENKHHLQKKEDVFLCIPPLYHTGAKMHWFGSFIVGGTSVLLKGIKAQDIIDVISQEKVSVVWLLVPWIHDILIAIENGEIVLNRYNVSQLRLMHSGAQPIPTVLIEKWKKVFPNMDYDTNYGLTETTGPGCIHLGIQNPHKIGKIGKAGFKWKLKIVDKEFRKLPAGETGELLVKGDGVMKEYYKNAKATQETIIDGWLKTGDIAREDEAGFIALVDRKKDVIITGGENIYPVQIEDFLIKHNKIKDVAVIGVPEKRLGEVACAIIQVKKNHTLNEDEVNDFCTELPRYKRPRKIIFADVPRNPTGKIEKPKLRRMYKDLK